MYFKAQTRYYLYTWSPRRRATPKRKQFVRFSVGNGSQQGLGLRFLDVLFATNSIYANTLVSIPRGSKYPILKVSRPKNHPLTNIWDQRA